MPLFRADSIGSISSVNGHEWVRFTGYDNHAYTIETSSNLVDWVGVSTNYPVNGTIYFTNIAPANLQFYRSILIK